MEHNCVICGKPAEATICEACARDWARRLAWLLKAGMPALQQIAYKQATTRERSPRHGNTAYAAPPVNETAQALFNAVEVHLQLMGGRLGIKPLGYDRYERARTLMQWADLIRLLLRRMRDLARLEDASGLYADTLRLAERVDAATSHSAEKRLIGVCPDCLNGRDEQGEPVRTPIYAAWDARYAICPACGAWLDLRRTRLEYLRSAGLMHITRTPIRRRPLDQGQHRRQRERQRPEELARTRQNARHKTHRGPLLGVECAGALGVRPGQGRTRPRRRLTPDPVPCYAVTCNRSIEKALPMPAGLFCSRWMVGRAAEGTRLLSGQA